MTMDRLVVVASGVVGVLGSVGSVFLAQAGALEPSQTIVGLATYGPLGIVALFLLVRNREKDREHAAEREADRARHASEREADRDAIQRLTSETAEGNRILASILEHIRRE